MTCFNMIYSRVNSGLNFGPGMWVEFLCFIAEELFWHVTELMHPSAAGDVHEKLRSEVLKAL